MSRKESICRTGMTVHSADIGFDTSWISSPEKWGRTISQEGRRGKKGGGWNSFTSD